MSVPHSALQNIMLLLPAQSEPGDLLVPILPQLKFSFDSCNKKHGNDVYLMNKTGQMTRKNIHSVGWWLWKCYPT